MSTDATVNKPATSTTPAEGFVDVSNEKALAAFKLGVQYGLMATGVSPTDPRLEAFDPEPTTDVPAAEKPAEEPKRAWWLGERGCPTWCTFTSSHHSYDSVGDRTHWSATTEVTLDLSDLNLLGDSEEQIRLTLDEDNAQPDTVGVYLEQGHYAAEPVVCLRTDDNRGFTFTLDEARILGRALLDLADKGSHGVPAARRRSRGRSKAARKAAAFRSGYHAAMEQADLPVVPGIAALLAGRQERFRRHFAHGYLSRMADVDDPGLMEQNGQRDHGE